MTKKTKVILLSLFSLFLVGAGYFFYLHQRKPYIAIPLQFIDNVSMPVVECEIEKNTYLLKIDLGSGSTMSLKQEILDKIKKTPLGVGDWIDINGNTYSPQTYKIEKAKLSNVKMTNIQCKEENADFINSGSVIYCKDPHLEVDQFKLTDGTIGFPGFVGVDSFFDLSNKKLFLVRKKDRFEKEQFSLQDYVSVPYELSWLGFVLRIEVATGEIRLLLDTGATHTFLRHSQVEPFFKLDVPKDKIGFLDSDFFIMGGHDFGPKEIYLMGSSFPKVFQEDIDGLLGMDFLRTRKFYIDATNKKILIEKTPQKAE